MRPEFASHKLNETGFAKARGVGEAFDALLDQVETASGWKDGDRSASARYVALVRTHLEQACFFAKKAVAVRPENQETAGS
jgi:hypothetical protein